MAQETGVTDDFLEEQLERMRRLSERMSQVHRRVTENSALISRDREALHGCPLDRVRDYRTHQSHDYGTRASRGRALAPRHPSKSRRRR
jgi:hypothetical protein